MDREEAVGRSAGRVLRQGKVEGAACLDAETLAAWSAGTLQPAERAAAEVHAADCSRCLAVLAAMPQAEPPARDPWWRVPLTVRWLAPAAAIGAAVALWVAVDPRVDIKPREQRPALQAPSAEPVPQQKPAEAAPAPEDRLADRIPEAKEERSRRDRVQASVPGRSPEAAAPATPAPVPDAASRMDQAGARSVERPEPPTVAESAAESARLAAGARQELRAPTEASLVVVSSDPSVRWRVRGAVVERSVDGGGTWETQQTGSAARIAAGSAPSASVCWLAGEAGTVLLTNDGRTWRQVVAPATADLVAITASDDRVAVVTTSAGTAYRTTDGGASWVLQETPDASFQE
ncbi:MAG TPA: YCF48-related protein [Vicinamibacterales bacterium]|nr:YCF48-related protein [Vicinamibacterales bacterium]